MKPKASDPFFVSVAIDSYRQIRLSQAYFWLRLIAGGIKLDQGGEALKDPMKQRRIYVN